MTLDDLREAVELARAAWQRAVLTGTQEQADAAYRRFLDCRQAHLDAYIADMKQRYDNAPPADARPRNAEGRQYR
ncbi:MAG TPA: hypothetical protein PK406_00755 [Verrucomicrobiota bacterium]|nr:hypothetical protein [Verrucomicrobiota bacterium]